MLALSYGHLYALATIIIVYVIKLTLTVGQKPEPSADVKFRNFLVIGCQSATALRHDPDCSCTDA